MTHFLNCESLKLKIMSLILSLIFHYFQSDRALNINALFLFAFIAGIKYVLLFPIPQLISREILHHKQLRVLRISQHTLVMLIVPYCCTRVGPQCKLDFQTLKVKKVCV